MSDTKTFYVLPDTVSVDDVIDGTLAHRFAPVEAEWWCALYAPHVNGACTYETRQAHEGEGCHWAILQGDTDEG
jgi:hypothetical protein